MEIRPSTVDELLAAPNWWALFDEYAAECGNSGIGKPDMQVDTYRMLEANGALKIIAAHSDNGELAGFIVYLLAVLPHYGKLVAMTESVFVLLARRDSGAGLALLKATEAAALEAGAAGLLVSAPAGGSLDRLLSAKHYEHTNAVWFKRLGALAEPIKGLPAMTAEAVGMAREAESRMLAMPQVNLPISHALHAGMYHRTVTIPAGVAVAGALIKIPTLLIVDGRCTVFIGGGDVTLEGHHVLECQPNRKQVFLAHADTHLTMIFPTQATTVEEAENEFTDEAAMLQSRQGERVCQE
jgi:hypothetical protein